MSKLMRLRSDGMDELEAQVESPTETRPVGTSGYGQGMIKNIPWYAMQILISRCSEESVQPPTKPVFRDEDSLPFARRGMSIFSVQSIENGTKYPPSMGYRIPDATSRDSNCGLVTSDKSRVPRHELTGDLKLASPTSPVDPFVQSSSVDSYELEMEDMAPAPVTPVSQVGTEGPWRRY